MLTISLNLTVTQREIKKQREMDANAKQFKNKINKNITETREPRTERETPNKHPCKTRSDKEHRKHRGLINRG